MRKMIVWLMLLLALMLSYFWFVVEGQGPADAAYELNLAKVRQLADSLPGEKPSQVRYEHVMSFKFRNAMVKAGDDWGGVEIPIYSYQVVYPEHTVMVDTGMNREIAQPGFMVMSYDDRAYQRVLQAMDRAELIVVTHEHMDHIGGLLANPNLRKILPAVHLTEAQLAHPEKMDPAKIPAGAFDGYQPLRYIGLHALAPGMVLIAAPGHTPGSQMVYIKLVDGRELLLLGDVAWQAGNIEAQRERPRFMTAIIGEDRTQVLGQFHTLHALALREPRLHQVPGHDGAVVAALTQAGLLQAGFVEAAAPAAP